MFRYQKSRKTRTYGQSSHEKELRRRRNMRLAHSYVDKASTVRKTADDFNISKTTAHKILSKIAEKPTDLGKSVRERLDINANEAPLRGGLATKEKYGGRLGVNRNGFNIGRGK